MILIMALGTIRVHTPGLCSLQQGLPPGTTAVRVAGVPCQADVLTRHPDGSIRTAILTFDAPAAGDYPLESTLPDQGSLPQAVPPNLVIRLTTGGQQWVSDPLPNDPRRYSMWLDGPVAAEGRVRLTFRNGATIHPFLAAVVDLRQHAGDRWTVAVRVENCSDQAGDAVTYGLHVSASGRVLLIQAGVTHYYLTCWQRTWHVTADGSPWEPGVALPDLSLYAASGLLERYEPGVADLTDGFPPGEPGLFGSWPVYGDMTAHGGTASLAPLPDWDGRLLAHARPEQLEFCCAVAENALAWPVSATENDGEPVRIDARPDYWLDPRAAHGLRPVGNLGATGPLTPDIAHQPAFGYVPFLLTGKRQYLDVVQRWANYCLLNSRQDWFNLRGGSAGHLSVDVQVRGMGWGLRNLANAAACTPDADPLKPYLEERVHNNLAYLDGQVANVPSPLGCPYEWYRWENYSDGIEPGDPEPLWNYLHWTQWEWNYVAGAVWIAQRRGFTAGGQATLQHILDLQYRWFENPTTRDAACNYRWRIGRQNPPGSLVPEFFTTPEECYRGAYNPVGSYLCDARLMLLVMQQTDPQRYPHAAEHLAYLMAYPGAGEFLAGAGSWGAGWYVQVP